MIAEIRVLVFAIVAVSAGQHVRAADVIEQVVQVGLDCDNPEVAVRVPLYVANECLFYGAQGSIKGTCDDKGVATYIDYTSNDCSGNGTEVAYSECALGLKYTCESYPDGKLVQQIISAGPCEGKHLSSTAHITGSMVHVLGQCSKKVELSVVTGSERITLKGDKLRVTLYGTGDCTGESVSYNIAFDECIHIAGLGAQIGVGTVYKKAIASAKLGSNHVNDSSVTAGLNSFAAIVTLLLVLVFAL